MIPQFDEKGKIFTNIISKIPVTVIIQTTLHKIQGELHTKPDERLKDELNSSEELIAVTNASIQDNQNQEILHCNFLLVNRSQIIWIAPSDELATNNQDLGI